MTAADPLLTAKLALERELVRPLSHVLMQYVLAKQDGLTVYARSGFMAQLSGVLLEHYARVVMVVTGRRPSRPTRVEDAALDQVHLANLRRRSATQSHLILTSVDREWDRTPETKADPQKGLYSKMLAKAKEVWRKIKSKLPAIITGETNGPAEEAREIEARKAAGNRPLYKWWSTMLDERVRDWHEAAEGQRRHVSEAYEVGGERLMFPGDMSMGASLRNVVNCRCSSVFLAINPDGSEEELARTPRLTPVPPRHMQIGHVDNINQISHATRIAEGAINRIFLTDLYEARLTVRNGVLRVTRRNETLATARYTHGVFSGPRVQDLRVTPAGEGLGIEALIQRSLGRQQ